MCAHQRVPIAPLVDQDRNFPMRKLIVLAALTLSLAACGHSEGERALTGGLIGAGGGAVVGSMTGIGPVGGAVIGGVGGAGIGAVTAH
jgi:hypothetical protein